MHFNKKSHSLSVTYYVISKRKCESSRLIQFGVGRGRKLKLWLLEIQSRVPGKKFVCLHCRSF